MLTPSSAAVVTSTLPAVRSHAEAITGAFYTRMFAAHPELLDLFNRGNQATGKQRQALAGAVVGYAEHLTAGSAVPWTPIVERIAHKHASLGITPAQYPIVGRHLLAAVGEVLGDAVTPDVARAWDEVYWLFACELVAREARLYQHAGVGDPAAVWRSWRVTDRVEETGDVVSLVLAPADGRPAGRFVPGQYVSVIAELGAGAGRQIRQYSLSGRPGADTWQITVKRVRAQGGAPAGAVSSFLHDSVAPGDELRVSPAFGDVSSVPGDGPLVLVSAGIGVTPAMSALEHLAEHGPQRPVVLVHADRAGSTHALRRHLPRLSRSLPELRLDLWYEHGADAEPVAVDRARVNAGRVNPDSIPLPPGAHVHLCGPLPFMNHVRSNLLSRGVPGDRIAYEVFGPEMLRS
ncbi:globin domain-containing protein [Couchioplanes caeruleus]|uniref:globin domain-containing protein n=1 Tax=Couchioplanes caeruleus TaxID=56438 RepID=UPI00201C0F35|nr:globin domain-containing protein [Couchioplanes caeruleus]UQU68028.1 globin domain-containing protein [Couchioplanes caeruleus]